MKNEMRLVMFYFHPLFSISSASSIFFFFRQFLLNTCACALQLRDAGPRSPRARGEPLQESPLFYGVQHFQRPQPGLGGHLRLHPRRLPPPRGESDERAHMQPVQI